MASDDLLRVFGVADLDQREFEEVLLEYFHRARGLSINEIVYPDQETEYALKLIYDHAQLVDIAPGPALKPDDITAIRERVERELLATVGTRIGRLVLFSSVPVNGYFRYKDRFQVVPVPPEAPRPQFVLGEHPFILEFAFPASSNMRIGHLRRALHERELELVLGAVLEFSIHSLGKRARFHWVLPPDVPPAQWRSTYLQEMYTWPGADLEGDTFTNIEDMSPLAAVPPAEYYSRIGIGPDRQLELPSNFELLLDRFFALSPADREKFLRACFWFRHARLVQASSRSATFTALISAVEALIPPERDQAVCESCKRPLGKGPTQRFIDFVEEFAPGVPTAERRRLYSIRSALSHGGSLLYSDTYALPAGLVPAQVKEWDDSRTTFQLVRLVLVGWLSTQG